MGLFSAPHNTADAFHVFALWFNNDTTITAENMGC